jgi:hypothetical protein
MGAIAHEADQIAISSGVSIAQDAFLASLSALRLTRRSGATSHVH